jgi:hypothetical protein
VVIRAIKRLFGGHEGPSSVSPEQAEIRLKGLKAKLVKNKSETKRLTSEVNKAKHLSADQKATHKARLKELETERKDLTREMKSLHKRIPKK